jgi:mannosyltransferase
VSPVEVGLDDHRVVGVVEGNQLVSLVGERGACLLEVARHLLRPVVDVAGADQLVARVVESRQRGVELVPVLRLHVLDHEPLALAANPGGHGHWLTLSLNARPARRSVPPTRLCVHFAPMTVGSRPARRDLAPHSVPPYVWAVPAGVALAVCLIAIGHRVLWQDELATLTASTRSLHDLAELARERDGVLAPYYAFMHIWIDVFGTSPLALRLPSALAMAGSAGITALIGARLFNPPAGLFAGVLLALLPVVSEFGQDARPYALTLLFAALSTLLLLRALERPEVARWSLYGVSLVGLGATQLTGLFVVGAHGFAVAGAWHRRRDRRLAGWLAACGLAAVALLPLVRLALQQTEQVAGVAPTTWRAIWELPGQLFGAPLVAAAVIALALLAALRQRATSVFCLALGIVPVVLVVLVSIEQPLLRSRYLLFTLLGWVLLAGAALSRGRKAAGVAMLVAILALGLSQQLDVRSKTLNDSQPDYRTIAAIMEGRVHEGDAIVVPTERGIRFRIGLQAYLPADARPDDVLATRDPAAAEALDSWECVPATCFDSPKRLWIGCDRAGPCSRDPLSGLRPETARALRERRYVPERVWGVEGGAISLYTLAVGDRRSGDG